VAALGRRRHPAWRGRIGAGSRVVQSAAAAGVEEHTQQQCLKPNETEEGGCSAERWAVFQKRAHGNRFSLETVKTDRFFNPGFDSDGFR
jgi:hypothetical protein